ncbi:MAG: hypothetical protein Q8J89_09540 [Caulobacter sp.]|nr:hypothetical protein [Caulobacter sp.]
MSTVDGSAAQVTQAHPDELDREINELRLANLRMDALLAEQRLRLAPWWTMTGAAALLAAILWAGAFVAQALHCLSD